MSVGFCGCSPRRPRRGRLFSIPSGTQRRRCSLRSVLQVPAKVSRGVTTEHVSFSAADSQAVKASGGGPRRSSSPRGGACCAAAEKHIDKKRHVALNTRIAPGERLVSYNRFDELNMWGPFLTDKLGLIKIASYVSRKLYESVSLGIHDYARFMIRRKSIWVSL